MGPYVIAAIVFIVGLACFPLPFAGLAAYYADRAGFQSRAPAYAGLVLGVLAAAVAGVAAGFV